MAGGSPSELRSSAAPIGYPRSADWLIAPSALPPVLGRLPGCERASLWLTARPMPSAAPTTPRSRAGSCSGAHAQAAVHGHHRAGDVAGLVGQQEPDGGR